MRLLKHILGTGFFLTSLTCSAEETHGPPSPEDLQNVDECLTKISESGQKQINEMKTRLKALDSLAVPNLHEQYYDQATELLKQSLERFSLATKIALYAHHKMESDGMGDKLRQKPFPFGEASATPESVTRDYCKLARMELADDPELLGETLLADIRERVEKLKKNEAKTALPRPKFWFLVSWPVYGNQNNAPLSPMEAEKLKYIKDYYEKFYQKKLSDNDLEKLHPILLDDSYAGKLSATLNLDERVAFKMLETSPKLQEAMTSEDMPPSLKPFREIVLSGLKKAPPYIGPANLGATLSDQELSRYQVGELIKRDTLALANTNQWGTDTYHRFRVYSKTGRRMTEWGSLFLLPGTSYKVLVRNEKSDGTVEIVMEEQ